MEITFFLIFILLFLTNLFLNLKKFAPIISPAFFPQYEWNEFENTDKNLLKKQAFQASFLVFSPLIIIFIFKQLEFHTNNAEILLLTFLIFSTSLLIRFSKKNAVDFQRREKIIQIKPGPGSDVYTTLAVKYVLIQEFYKEERLETRKHKNQKEFLEKTCDFENEKRKLLDKEAKMLNVGSFKNAYSKIKKMKLEDITNRHFRIIKKLNCQGEFDDYEKIKQYLKKRK